METYDVSVIIPVYNSAPWLHECLNSALRQTGVNIQIICVNDGSTDQSAAILSEYANIHNNIVVITQPNGGLSAARNSGLEAATGRYTVLLDSDDYWRSDSLKTLVAYADENNLELLGFDAIPFPALGVDRETWQRYRTYYRQRNYYEKPRTGLQLAVEMQKHNDYRPAAWKFLFASTLITRHNLSFLPGVIHEDNAFTFHLYLVAHKAAQLPIPFYGRRVRPESIMTSIAAERSVASLAQVCGEMEQELAAASLRATDDEMATLRHIIEKVRDYSAKISTQAAMKVP